METLDTRVADTRADDSRVIDGLIANETEMAERVRAFDWAGTSLGPPSTWPETLQVALGICLNSRFPMFLWWGPDLIQFNNDAYIPILGQKHPDSLGQPARQVWAEIWPDIEPQILDVMRDGSPSWNERVPLKLHRNGFLEDTWFTWSYSPIPDGEGRIGGLFCAVTEETKNVLAEARLDMLSEQRQLALSSAELGWWQQDIETQVVVWDERFKEIFGVTDDSMEFGEIMQSIHPEDRERIGAVVRETIESGSTEPYEVEARVTHPDGSVHWISSRGELHHQTGADGHSRLHLVGTVADITERKQTADALLERTRLAELSADIGLALTSKASDLASMLSHCSQVLVDHLDAAFARIWTVNDAGTVLELQSSAGMYSHLDGPHSRVPVGQFKIGLIAQERKPHMTNHVVGDPRVANQEWARREGMVAFAGYPLVVEDRLIGVVAIFSRHPLTRATMEALGSISNAVALGIERRRGEDEKISLLENERSARQQAETTNRIKDEFLATLSHELRTPLQAILGWTHLLLAGELIEGEMHQGFEVIERNTLAQVQLVEDLLDVSRIITGKLRLDVQPVDLNEVILNSVEAVRPTAQAKAIRLQMLLDPEAGFISGDSNRVQQIVWNLLTNAVKFTPKEGRVQVRLERVHSHVEIAVIDTGQGIDPEFLPHTFDRFRQADQTSTRRHGGLGLGLSIVRQLVELHGGTISASSPGLGQGSTFTVSLPQMALRSTDLGEGNGIERRHPTAGKSQSSGEHLLGCPPELDGLKVLLVDDEPDSRTMLQVVMEHCKATVTTAGSAGEAFDAFVSLRPDIVVSDIGMPEQDGYYLIEKIRAWEAVHGGRAPAVALTAYARVEDRVRALRSGFQVHVPKPVEPLELLAVVASLTDGGK